jgi:hypothetical protein
MQYDATVESAGCISVGDIEWNLLAKNILPSIVSRRFRLSLLDSGDPMTLRIYSACGGFSLFHMLHEIIAGRGAKWMPRHSHVTSVNAC